MFVENRKPFTVCFVCWVRLLWEQSYSSPIITTVVKLTAYYINLTSSHKLNSNSTLCHHIYKCPTFTPHSLTERSEIFSVPSSLPKMFDICIVHVLHCWTFNHFLKEWMKKIMMSTRSIVDIVYTSSITIQWKWRGNVWGF